LDKNILCPANPNYVFLSTEPFPFEEKHFAEVQTLFPNSKIVSETPIVVIFEHQKQFHRRASCDA
jgi:hypothetical protein